MKPDSDWAAVGAAVRARMRERGLTGDELAEVTGMTRITVLEVGQRVELGKSNSTVPSLW